VRVVFERMPDRRPVETEVFRDDGVVFRMRGAGGGADLPHDLVHLLVELSLGVPDGIFGCIAQGVEWRSMRHVSGRRPPHAAERSSRLKRDRAAHIQAAELLADVVGRLSRGQPVLPAEASQTGYPLEILRAVAAELAASAEGWVALAPGERWTLSWPGPGSSPGRRATGRGRRHR
jgi:hypothetical protein